MSNNIENKNAVVLKLNNLWVEWHKDKQLQRFGQYAVNKLNLKIVPHIFYETDPVVAFDLLTKHLLEIKA